MIEVDISKIIEIIMKNNYKKIVIQLPDGLKPKALEISKIIEKKTGVTVFIWLDSCYGGCDVPIWLKEYGFDAIFHIGHFNMLK